MFNVNELWEKFMILATPISHRESFGVKEYGERTGLICMTGHHKTAYGYKGRRATKEDGLKHKNICQY